MFFEKISTKSQVFTNFNVTKSRFHCMYVHVDKFQKVSFVYHDTKYFELKLHMTVLLCRQYCWVELSVNFFNKMENKKVLSRN